MIKNIESHLKEACQLTGATWALVADCDQGRWFVSATHHPPKLKARALDELLAKESTVALVESALRGKVVRPVSLPKASKLLSERLYVFALREVGQVMLVGANRQSAPRRRIWQLVARLLQSHDGNEVSDNYLPDLQSELAGEMPRVLDRVLARFVEVAKPQGAWLAIRRGDMLEVAAAWNDPRLQANSLQIESNPLLQRLQRSLGAVTVRRSEQAEWAELPNAVRKSTGSWVCLPLVIGHQLIGAVALWGGTEFQRRQIKTLGSIAGQVSQTVEVVVTFNELTGHLHRLAMLNDFALAISSAQNLEQIARRVFAHLARSFGTELIALRLPSLDGRLVRDFRNREGKFSTQTSALAGNHVQHLLKSHVARLNEAASDFKPIYAGARSALNVPLRYRGQTIGVLSLESTRYDAFSQYDENLMVVIASHIAGLIEYGRLREEAEARARNLGLIHEVVQQVIGLNDKFQVTQIAADSLAEYFAFELAAVMLVDADPTRAIVGFGGSKAQAAQEALSAEDYPVKAGVTGHVVGTGESLLVNDTAKERRYVPLRGWDAGSELCVPLKDGDQVVGFIDVESSQRNAFSSNDLLALQSLAGVLGAVISSANQYERLQETIHQLRAAEVESRARLNAQQEAESRLVQAAKLVAVGEMAAGIAHELNNPLTTVTGFTELILDETPTDTPRRADLEMVLHEALRARGVVRRLLDFARQGEPTRSRLDLNEVVEDVLALTTHFIHISGVRLDVSFQRDLPWVSVDSNQMKQVFLNLVHNAIQAMPTGGALQIKTETRLRQDREWAVVEINDSGIGIDPRDMDRIFEPFFTTKGNRGGTGLGLSVTYGIVTDHGGTIEVTSRPGEGSSFAVWLPI